MIKKYILNKKLDNIRYIDWETLLDTFPNTNKPESISLHSLALWRIKELHAISYSIDRIEHFLKLKCCCSKGCSYCCRQAIYIDPAEYEILKYNLQSLNFALRKSLKNVAFSICHELKNTIVPLILSNSLSKDEQLAINNEYFSLNINCPFLDANNCCMIYDYRPFVCLIFRNYGHIQDCMKSCSPLLAYTYREFDVFSTERLYINSYPFLKHSFFTLLPYAISQIL